MSHVKIVFSSAMVIGLCIGLSIVCSFPDIFAINYVPFMAPVSTVYSWVNTYSTTCTWVSAAYPPLYFALIRIYLHGVALFIPSFSAPFFSTPCPFAELAYNQTFLFWIKLPYLLCHIGSAIIFSKFFSKYRTQWFLFWLISPIAIFVNFVMGQFDSIPVFCMILSLYFLYKKQPIYAGIALGLGGAIKNYPLLLMIPMALTMQESIKKRIYFIVSSICVYSFSLLLVQNNANLVQMALFSENTRMFVQKITLGNISIPLFAVLYIASCSIGMLTKNKTFTSILATCLLCIISYYITTPGWCIQRVMIMLPMLYLLYGTNSTIRFWVFIFQWLVFGYLFIQFPGLFDHTLFRPILPITSITYIISPLLQIITIPIINTIFIVLAIITIRIKNHPWESSPIKIHELVGHISSLVGYMTFLIYLTTVSTI
jgi:hypothetical protein